MIKDMKYIVVKNELENVEYIFPFPRNIDHDKMFKAMRRLRFDTIISAGFINEFMECYGRSQTLRVSYREGSDTQLLKESFQINDKKFTFRDD